MDDQGVDIFQELLDEDKGKRPVTLSKYLQSLNASDGFQVSIQSQSNSLPATHFNVALSSHVTSKGWTVLAECQDDKFHYLLVDKNCFASILIYHLSRQTSISDRLTSQPEHYHSFNTALRSSLFQDVVQQGKKYCFLYVLHQNYSLGQSHANVQKDKFYVGRRRPGNISLPLSLFAYLFGPDLACLLSTTPLLLCCNNGDIFSYFVESKFSGRLQLFCSIHTPIVTLVPVTLAEEDSGDEGDQAKRKMLESLRVSLGPRLSEASRLKNGKQDGLLVVGSSGESCLFIEPPSPGLTIPVLILLPGPVTSCVTVGKHLIYSTGTCVETYQLVLYQREDQTFISLRSYASLGQANIIDLQIQDLEETSECLITGITNHYDMISIAVLRKTVTHSHDATFDFHDDLGEGEGDHRDNPARLKDTLSALNAHTDAVKSCHKRSHEMDSTLLQLNLFATISQQHKMSRLTKENQCYPQAQGHAGFCVVQCQCELVDCFNKTPGADAWTLRVKLTNGSSTSFSDQWSVLVTQSPVYVCSPNSSYKSSSPMCHSFQFRLENGLQPKSDMVFTVPIVDSIQFDYLLELHISVSLTLCMNPAHKDKVRPQTEGETHRLMEVEIHRQVVDVLHFLRRTSDSQENERCFPQEQTCDMNWLERQLRKLANARCGGYEGYNGRTSGNSNSEIDSFFAAFDLPVCYVEEKIINRSSQILEFILDFKPSLLQSQTTCSLLSPSQRVVSLSSDLCDTKDLLPQNGDMGRFSLTVKTCNVLVMFAVLEAIVRRTRMKKGKEQHTAPSRLKLECQLHDLKRVRSRLMENFNVIKFGSQLCSDYQNAFCHFLESLREIKRLGDVNF